jgi:hypothetical protein
MGFSIRVTVNPYLTALLFGGGNALAAERLSDPQMDLISAGAVPTCSAGPGCNTSFSSTTTNTVPDANGVLHTTTTGTFSCSADSCTVLGIVGSTNANNGSLKISTLSTVGTPPPLPPFPH